MFYSNISKLHRWTLFQAISDNIVKTSNHADRLPAGGSKSHTNISARFGVMEEFLMLGT